MKGQGPHEGQVDVDGADQFVVERAILPGEFEQHPREIRTDHHVDGGVRPGRHDKRFRAHGRRDGLAADPQFGVQARHRQAARVRVVDVEVTVDPDLAMDVGL